MNTVEWIMLTVNIAVLVRLRPWKNEAQQLIDGSRNIDQMRKDIDQTMSMIFGLIGLENLKAELIKRQFNRIKLTSIFSSYSWHINYFVVGDEIMIDCLQYGIGGSAVATFSSYNKNGITEKMIHDLHKTYKALPVFVKGMKRVFPELKSKLRPFKNAGKVKLD